MILHCIQGPITTARARQLNLEVNLFLSNSLYDFENKLLANNYVVRWNQGEDQETHKGGPRGMEDQQGRPNEDGDLVQLEFELALAYRNQDQPAVKWTPKTHSDSVFDDPRMNGKIIS